MFSHRQKTDFLMMQLKCCYIKINSCSSDLFCNKLSLLPCKLGVAGSIAGFSTQSDETLNGLQLNLADVLKLKLSISQTFECVLIW